MAKDAYWFRHDCNAGRDAGILEMRSIYKLKGYAIFWLIIEYLREQDGYKLKVGKYGYTPLSGAIGVKLKLLEKFIDDCVKEFGLFVIIDGYLTSERLQNDMLIWEKNKANGKKGGRPKKPIPKPIIKPKPNPNENPNDTITESTVQREENITEITESTRPIFAPKNIEIIIEYFVLKSDKTEAGMKQAKEAAKSFWREYESTGWYYKGSVLQKWRPRADSWLGNWIDNEEKKPTKKEEVKYETE